MLDNIKVVGQKTSEDLKYSILIPSWNNLEFLKLCVNSINKNSHYKHQLIIIINEGGDGSLEWVIGQDNIDYVHSKTNIGICYGLNSARSLIKTDYVVYANDDMYFLPGWDIEVDNEISSIGHENFMLSSTMIEPSDTGNPCVIVADYGDSLASFDEGKLLNEFNDQVKGDWSGATWPPTIVPLKLWDMVGGMSVEFSPGFYSDPDLSMKLWHMGVRYFKGIGKSRVYHFGSKSTKRIKKNDGKNLFLAKWGITSNFFTEHYLKRGKDFRVLDKPKIGNLDMLINKFKKIIKS